LLHIRDYPLEPELVEFVQLAQEARYLRSARDRIQLLAHPPDEYHLRGLQRQGGHAQAPSEEYQPPRRFYGELAYVLEEGDVLRLPAREGRGVEKDVQLAFLRPFGGRPPYDEKPRRYRMAVYGREDLPGAVLRADEEVVVQVGVGGLARGREHEYGVVEFGRAFGEAEEPQPVFEYDAAEPQAV